MKKEDKPPLEVKLFELVLKRQLEMAITNIFEQAIHPEMEGLFNSLSAEEQKEFDQKILAVIEKVFPELIGDLRKRLSAIAEGYEQFDRTFRKPDPFAN